MKNSIVWFGRKFKFTLPPGMYPIIIERMRGAPVRLEEKTAGLTEKILTDQRDGWSIKEQTGHLVVVEELWHGRIDDYNSNAERLRPADLENRKTKDADFNSADIGDLLGKFRQSRESLVTKFERFGDDEIEKTALHPRLDQPMRIIDLAYFIVEHDDHHLAKMTDIKKKV
jgi:uncharacterized damage-inducible protein DinB